MPTCYTTVQIDARLDLGLWTPEYRIVLRSQLTLRECADKENLRALNKLSVCASEPVCGGMHVCGTGETAAVMPQHSNNVPYTVFIYNCSIDIT